MNTETGRIPDPATLEGEDLNYWCGVAARWEPVDLYRNSKLFLDSQGILRWNPIENAEQCLELTPNCYVLPQEYGGYIASLKSYPLLGSNDWQAGETELIARCRAYLASKLESDRRGE